MLINEQNYLKVLNNEQYDACIELRKHLTSVRDLQIELKGSYYADLLDSVKVPWPIQNRISELVDDPRMDHVQLHKLLELDLING
ncbi:hypothetical protein ACOQ0N_004278 [Vibrio parahaemolyticus]|uniref:Uncharacterized protein n=1 Tax=Vibrio alginolyticus TaxID=663 RepID=A0A7Y4EZ36_VIBAL|nr:MULTISPECIES: hypothetical protein [Vibrio harveyi group]EGQ8101425.1 hypothetical protein [Vibrio parahaemolyticus]EGQ8551636.1 hypothetical protein [Vibrio parahaemolyticus]EGQ9289498.1 hypothetical protein [Vibrio parahaemolyticus]EGR3168497.1 hypothetical protein [Vibrio parahaemolyticus]EJB8449755.1 hypothetical protein [Vibrio parahaemolyticus]